MDVPLEDETNYYDYENITQNVAKKEKNKRKRSNSEPRTGLLFILILILQN